MKKLGLLGALFALVVSFSATAPASAATLVDGRAGHDSIEPGLDRRAPVELARGESAMRLHVGLLHDVFGVGDAARDARGVANEQRARKLHDSLEPRAAFGQGAPGCLFELVQIHSP